MSKLKLGIAGSKFVGTKIKDLAKKLKKKKVDLIFIPNKNI